MLSWQYVAGLIDGEGGMGMHRRGRNTDGTRLTVEVNMTCYDTVKALHDTIGGTFKPKKVPEGNKPQWRCRVVGVEAAGILKQIQPHSVTKRKLINYLLEQNS